MTPTATNALARLRRPASGRGDHVGLRHRRRRRTRAGAPEGRRGRPTRMPDRRRRPHRGRAAAALGVVVRTPRPSSCATASASPRAGTSPPCTGCCTAAGAATRLGRGRRSTASTRTRSPRPRQPDLFDPGARRRRARTSPSAPTVTSARSGSTAAGRRRRPTLGRGGPRWRSTSPRRQQATRLDARCRDRPPAPGDGPRRVDGRAAVRRARRRRAAGRPSASPSAIIAGIVGPRPRTAAEAADAARRRATPTCCATPRRAASTDLRNPARCGRCCAASASRCPTPGPGGSSTPRRAPAGRRPADVAQGRADRDDVRLRRGSTSTSAPTAGCAARGPARDGAAGRMTAIGRPAQHAGRPARRRRRRGRATCSCGPTSARSSRACSPPSRGDRAWPRRPAPTTCTRRSPSSSASTGRRPRSPCSGRCTARPPATAPRPCAASRRPTRWPWPTSHDADVAGPGRARTCAPYGGRLVRMGTTNANEVSERDARRRRRGAWPLRPQRDGPGRGGRAVQDAGPSRCAPAAPTSAPAIVLCLHDELLVHAPADRGRRPSRALVADCLQEAAAALGARRRGPLRRRHQRHRPLVRRQVVSGRRDVRRSRHADRQPWGRARGRRRRTGGRATRRAAAPASARARARTSSSTRTHRHDRRPAPPPLGARPEPVHDGRAARRHRQRRTASTNTVFVECGSGYRTDGPEAFRPVGETEFVVAADPDGFIAGIVGFADLTAPEIADVLAAHVDAGGRPVPRHPPRQRVRRQPRRPRVAHQAAARACSAMADFRRGLRRARGRRAQLRRLAVPPAAPRADRPGPRPAGRADRARPPRRAARHRAVRRPARRGPRRRGGASMADVAACAERRAQARRHRHADLRDGLAPPGRWRHRRAARRGLGRADPLVHRAVRRRPLHVRVELPRRQGLVQLRRAVGGVRA